MKTKVFVLLTVTGVLLILIALMAIGEQRRREREDAVQQLKEIQSMFTVPTAEEQAELDRLLSEGAIE